MCLYLYSKYGSLLPFEHTQLHMSGKDVGMLGPEGIFDDVVVCDHRLTFASLDFLAISAQFDSASQLPRDHTALFEASWQIVVIDAKSAEQQLVLGIC